MTDEELMYQALALAEQSAREGEVPVGCVVTLDGRIVGRGRNRRETNKTALAHAELEAISEACRTLGGWRQPGRRRMLTSDPHAPAFSSRAP